MGMFDTIRCKYPLPVLKYKDNEFQTKDTPRQWCDLYEIREDGTLWHEAYDIEDRSDPNAEGLEKLIGCMTPVNKRWEPVNYIGEIRFYGFPTDDYRDGGWIEFSAYFIDGRVKEINLIENTPPEINIGEL